MAVDRQRDTTMEIECTKLWRADSSEMENASTDCFAPVYRSGQLKCHYEVRARNAHKHIKFVD